MAIQFNDLHINALLHQGKDSPVARALVRSWLSLLDDIRASPTQEQEVEAVASEIWRRHTSASTHDDDELLQTLKLPEFKKDSLSDAIALWVVFVDVGQWSGKYNSEEVESGGRCPAKISHAAWIGCIMLLHQQLDIPDSADDLFGHRIARIHLSMALSTELPLKDDNWVAIARNVINSRTHREVKLQLQRFDLTWIAYT